MSSRRGGSNSYAAGASRTKKSRGDGGIGEELYYLEELVMALVFGKKSMVPT